MRNLLEEFNEDHGVRPPTILGVREHIFTGRFVLFLPFFAFLCGIKNFFAPSRSSIFEVC